MELGDFTSIAFYLPAKEIKMSSYAPWGAITGGIILAMLIILFGKTKEASKLWLRWLERIAIIVAMIVVIVGIIFIDFLP